MRLARKVALTAAVLTATAVAAGCGGKKSPNTDMLQENLMQVAAQSPHLSTFLSLAQTAGLENILAGNDPVTVLAPSNSAFDKLSKGQFDALTNPSNKGELLTVLKNHIISGSLDGEDLRAMDAEPTNLLGSVLPLETEGRLSVGGANLIEMDLRGSNGVVHVIDRVLMP